MSKSLKTNINTLIGRAVLLPLPFLLFLLQFFDTLFKHIGPEITLKIGQFFGAGETILCCLFEYVL